MNSINLIGNICNDVELKKTQSDKSVCSFNLAVSRPFAKDTTDFIPVVCWGNQAEIVSKYTRKGTKIGVSGALTSRKYTDKDGNNRTAFEVVVNNVHFIESKKTDNDPLEVVKGKLDDFAEISADDDLPFN